MILRGTLYKSIQLVGSCILVKKRKKWQWLKAHNTTWNSWEWKLILQQKKIYFTFSMSFSPIHCFWSASSPSSSAVALPQLYFEAITAQHLLLPLRPHSHPKDQRNVAHLRRRAPVSVSLCPSLYPSLSSFLSTLDGLSKTIWHDTVRATAVINYLTTFRMILTWPLQERISNSKMTPFLINDLRARVVLSVSKVMQQSSKYWCWGEVEDFSGLLKRRKITHSKEI